MQNWRRRTCSAFFCEAPYQVTEALGPTAFMEFECYWGVGIFDQGAKVAKKLAPASQFPIAEGFRDDNSTEPKPSHFSTPKRTRPGISLVGFRNAWLSQGQAAVLTSQ
jgi:hypothetical protein